MAETSEMDSNEIIGSVTIAASAKLSSAFNLGGYMLKLIKVPAAFSGTALKIKVATTDTSAEYTYLYKTGADVSFTVAASKAVDVFDSHICARWIKIESQTTEGAARTVQITAVRW